MTLSLGVATSFAYTAPVSATAPALYCHAGSSEWSECLLYTRSGTTGKIQAQSNNYQVEGIYGHTNLTWAKQGSCAAGGKNSANAELGEGATQTVSITFNDDLCVYKFCAIFWSTNNNGGWDKFESECHDIDT